MIPCSVLMMLSSVEEFATRMKRRTQKVVWVLSCGMFMLQILTAHIPTFHTFPPSKHMKLCPQKKSDRETQLTNNSEHLVHDRLITCKGITQAQSHCHCQLASQWTMSDHTAWLTNLRLSDRTCSYHCLCHLSGGPHRYRHPSLKSKTGDWGGIEQVGDTGMTPIAKATVSEWLCTHS